MTESRVEAVADAVGNVRNRQGNFAITCPGDALAIAQATLEANDAWLKARHEPALWAASDRIMEWKTIRDLAYHEPGLPHALARYCIDGYQEALPNIEPEEPDR